MLPCVVFSAIRAHALCGKNRIIGLLVFALSAVPVAINLVSKRVVWCAVWRDEIEPPQVRFKYNVSGVNYAPFGCLELDDMPAIVALRFGLPRLVCPDKCSQR